MMRHVLMQVTIYNMCYMASRMRTVAVYGNTQAEGGDGGVSLFGRCSADLPVTVLSLSSCSRLALDYEGLAEPVGALTGSYSLHLDQRTIAS